MNKTACTDTDSGEIYRGKSAETVNGKGEFVAVNGSGSGHAEFSIRKEKEKNGKTWRVSGRCDAGQHE